MKLRAIHQQDWPLHCVISLNFGKPAFLQITASICGGIYARVLYFVVRVRCRKGSSRSLSHLLMSFLLAPVALSWPSAISIVYENKWSPHIQALCAVLYLQYLLLSIITMMYFEWLSLWTRVLCPWSWGSSHWPQTAWLRLQHWLTVISDH